jgi:hypothetical protein
LPLRALTTFCTWWLKSICVGGFGGVVGLIRVAGAALAAATACGGTSSSFGGVTSEAFLGAPGAGGPIFGVCTGIALGGGGTTCGICTGVTLGGAGSGVSTGTLLGGAWAGRDGAAS